MAFEEACSLFGQEGNGLRQLISRREARGSVFGGSLLSSSSLRQNAFSCVTLHIWTHLRMLTLLRYCPQRLLDASLDFISFESSPTRQPPPRRAATATHCRGAHCTSRMTISHHSHSGEFCCHAKGTLAEVVDEAIRQGFTTFGLSEHVPRYELSHLYPEEVSIDESSFSSI